MRPLRCAAVLLVLLGTTACGTGLPTGSEPPEADDVRRPGTERSLSAPRTARPSGGTGSPSLPSGYGGGMMGSGT